MFLISANNPIVLTVYTTRHGSYCSKCNAVHISEKKDDLTCGHLWFYKTSVEVQPSMKVYTQADIDRLRRLKRMRQGV